MNGPTPEARAESSAAKQALAASTPATTRPGSETTTLTVGDAVVCHQEGTRTASWRGYEGRNGWVASVNRQTFPNGTTYVEVGVCWFQPGDWSRVAVDTWFRADELRPI